jgi:ribosomal protein S18 acetylase RimI-like enzyme
MITLDDIAEIQYGLLEEGDVGEMSGLLADIFSRYEPPAVAAGLSFREIEQIVAAFGPKAVTEQLTVLARRDGELVGALLVEDFGTPPPEGLEEFAPNFAPIGALLDGLDARYRESRRIVPGAYLHLFMIGVSPAFSGRGIAQSLINTCLANGRRRGFTVAVTEATGSVSQRVFAKSGFRGLFSTSYKDFLFDGQRVFSSIVEHDGCVLMERTVDAKQTGSVEM